MASFNYYSTPETKLSPQQSTTPRTRSQHGIWINGSYYTVPSKAAPETQQPQAAKSSLMLPPSPRMPPGERKQVEVRVRNEAAARAIERATLAMERAGGPDADTPENRELVRLLREHVIDWGDAK